MNDIPVSTIKENSSESLPVNSDSTIMEDGLVTMDSVALMGGQVVGLDELFTTIPRKS